MKLHNIPGISQPRAILPTVFASILLVSVTSILSASEYPELLWETIDINVHDCSPVTGSDGTIYITNRTRNINDMAGLYAFNPDGTVKWIFQSHFLFITETTPAIGDDGTIYFANHDSLYAVNPDGSEKWGFEIEDIVTSPAIGYDGSIYIGDNAGILYAISQNGQLLWRHATGKTLEPRDPQDGPAYKNIESSPIVGQDGTIYLACRDHYVYAINPDGVLKWEFETSYLTISASPAIGADGTIYHGNSGNRFYAINPDGTEKWNIQIDGVGYGSPAVAADGSIYVGSVNGSHSALYKILPDGIIEWDFPAETYIWSSVAIGNDGAIYFGCDNNLLYALNPDGTTKWTYQLDYRLRSCPTLTEDGTMYLCNDTLTALATDAYGYPQGSSWPAFTYSPKRSIAGNDITLPVHYTVKGLVTLPDKTPLTGVPVAVNGLMTETDESGWYSLSLPYGSYTLTVYVESTVVPKEKEFVVTGGDVVLDLYEGSGGLLHDVSGRVYTWDGVLENAIISTQMTSTETDANGLFLLEMVQGAYSLEIDAGENRFPSIVDLTVNKDNVDLGDIFINIIDWTYSIETVSLSYPAVGPNGNVYFITDDLLIAFTPDGEHYADIQLEQFNVSSPVTDQSGIVYYSSWGAVHAYNADLSPKWVFSVPELGVGTAPAIDDDGTLYFAAIDKMYAITHDGELKWQFFIGDRVNATPVIGPDGTIYVTNSDHSLYAIDKEGQLQWEFATGGTLSVSPVIGDDGTLYFGSYDNYFYALNSDGTVKWKFLTTAAISSNAKIGKDGTIYMASQNYRFYALNSDGSLKWEFHHNDYIDIDFWICPYSGEIWLHDTDETIVLRPDGTVSWRTSIAYKGLASSPDGRIFAVTESSDTRTGSLHAIRGGGMGKRATPVAVESSSFSNQSIQQQTFDNVVIYPNPFNPATSIKFTLPQEMNVTVDVYATTGQKVATLVDGPMSAGTHIVKFDGTSLSSGIYFARLESGRILKTAKMLLVK